MTMQMELEPKIRKLLGDDYHLYSDNRNKWVLYKFYDDPKIYFSKDNKPIMSSETHTWGQLYKFAKEHHKINEHFVLNRVRIIILWLNIIMAFINAFFFKKTFISLIIIYSDILILIEHFIASNIWSNNTEIDIKESIERIKDYDRK